MVALLYLSVFLLLLSCLISTINSPESARCDVGRGFYGVAVGLALAGLIALAAHGISYTGPEKPEPAIVKTVSN
jgi:hypothetical protein